MIMPISAVSNQTKPTFKGAVKNTEFLNNFLNHFTKSDKIRWDTVKHTIEKSKDNKIYEVSNDVLQIGKTIIKSLVIKEGDSNILAKEVYNITKGGSVHLFSRESAIRTILETFETLYGK